MNFKYSVGQKVFFIYEDSILFGVVKGRIFEERSGRKNKISYLVINPTGTLLDIEESLIFSDLIEIQDDAEVFCNRILASMNNNLEED